MQGLIDRYVGLSTDFLGQACLVHLALTTQEPSKLFKPTPIALYNTVTMKSIILNLVSHV